MESDNNQGFKKKKLFARMKWEKKRISFPRDENTSLQLLPGNESLVSLQPLIVSPFLNGNGREVHIYILETQPFVEGSTNPSTFQVQT